MSGYRIVVRTGTIDYGGTDSNIYVTLFGKAGNSGERHLAAGEGAFEKGVSDVFSISSDELGELEWLRVRHDNSGDDDGWFLEQITVEHEGDHRVWVFPCHRWLADDEDDRTTDRMLPVAVNGSRAHRAGAALAQALGNAAAIRL